jgi:hypothetical protein
VSEIAVDFLAGTDIASRLIEWFGAGEWSHCASVLSDGRYLDSRNDVLTRADPLCHVPDKVPAGVHIRDPKSEKWIRKRRATLQVSLTEYQEWEANLRAHVTAKYDRKAILGFLEGESMHTAGRWICDALALNSVQHIHRVPFPLVKPAHRCTPGEVLLILQTAGFTIGEVQVQP